MSADVKVKLQTTNKNTPIHVLHVDDDSSVLEISKQILMDMDDSFEFDCACCVDEGFKKLSNGHYDVVVCDYEMPKKNGLRFLKELREQNNKTPFILFTGKGREEVAMQALNLGADGYYNKHGSPETVYGELCYGIIQTVERKRAEEALRKSEHLNQKILNSTPNLIYIYDIAEKRNVYANHEIIDFLGYTQKQIIAIGSELFSNILHPDDAKAVAEHHARFINAPDNVVYDIEYRMKHARGEWRWLHNRDTLFTRTKEGTGKQILGICEDVTQHRQIECALKASGLCGEFSGCILCCYF
jgi:PAS domain S-box-containing protein